IDTETDHRTGEGEGEPSLIQIQPVTTVGKEQIILIETKQLPYTGTKEHKLIRDLLTNILNKNKPIYSWSNLYKELKTFDILGLFEYSELPVIYDVQYHFKKWYNRQYPHTPECQMQKDDEDNLLDEYVFLGNKVPTTHLNDIKQADYMKCIRKHRKHKNRSLDKRYQLSKWSCGLDIRNSSYRQYHDFVPPAEVKSGMTQYASHDCFSVTRLQVAIKNNWSKLDIGEKFAHTWEKYLQSYTEQLIQDEQEQYQDLNVVDRENGRPVYIHYHPPIIFARYQHFERKVAQNQILHGMNERIFEILYP
ncbi:unnamed protein product, partial [Didymodactylos carnosus]